MTSSPNYIRLKSIYSKSCGIESVVLEKISSNIYYASEILGIRFCRLVYLLKEITYFYL